jgi:AcrR family transcriptional regulator
MIMNKKEKMMNKRDAVKTRARILEVAEKIFSEAGFDGARVDVIAKEAGVNKALIYYYFKSKEEILDILFTDLVEDAKQILIKSLEGTPDISQGDNYRQIFNKYMKFIIKKRKIIRVAIGESTKSSAKHSIVMHLGDLIIDAKIESLRAAYTTNGMDFPIDKQEILVTEFFTGLMPLLSYALYKDEWEKYYNISEEELLENFYNAFKKTHIAAHSDS